MKSFEKKIYSQNGEDGIIEHIFDRIGTTDKCAVEFGVSAGGGGTETNTRLLSERGWNLFWFDVEDATNLPKNCTFTKKMLTKDNIVDEFRKLKIPTEFDLLSIDVDGNDYHLRQSLEHYSPRVCVLEYNGCHPADFHYIMPYDDNYRWTLWKTDFGASLKSFTVQANNMGYDLVYCESKGVNAFFIRKDVNIFPSLTSEQAYVKLWWAR